LVCSISGANPKAHAQGDACHVLTAHLIPC
jgi:hypothetical protein